MLGENLKAFRERLGLSQPDFAGWLNDRLSRRYDKQKISGWERNAERIPQLVADLIRKEVTGPAVEHGPALVVAVANQKGGVGKTTTAVNAASRLAQDGYRVLLVDADPQANATMHFGFSPVDLQRQGKTIDTVLRDGTSIEGIIATVGASGLDLVPSSIRLSKTEAELMARPANNFILRKLLAPARAVYDFILIDTPPHLGQMTLNGLTACDTVLIPCQTELMAVVGVEYLLETIAEIRSLCHPTLAVQGILPTMYQQRLSQDRESLQDLQRRYAGAMRVFDPVPRATSYAQAFAAGRALVEAIPDAPGAAVIRTVVEEMVAERARRVAPRTLEAAHGA